MELINLKKCMTTAALMAAMAFGSQSLYAREDADAAATADAAAADADRAVDNAADEAETAADRAAERTRDAARDAADTAGDVTDSAGDALDQAGDAAAQPAAGRDRAAQPRQPAARPGQGQGQAKSSARQSGQQSAQDKARMFVEKAASSDMMEIALAQLAQERATRDEVKQFAQHIVKDHTQSSKQLQQIAKKKGMQIPQQMRPVHQAMVDEMQQLQGEDFEKAFVYGNVASHTKAVLKFRDASQELQDPELKNFAATVLPKLKQHLQHAQQLAGWDQAQTAGGRLERATGELRSAVGGVGSDASGDPTGSDATGSDPTDTATPAGGDRQNPDAPAGQEDAPADTNAGGSSDETGGRTPGSRSGAKSGGTSR